MPFSLTKAEDALQCKTDTIFGMLNFATGLADDMIIWTK